MDRMHGGMHSRHYVSNLIKTVEDLLQEDGRELKGRWSGKTHTTPLPKAYKLELDDTGCAATIMRPVIDR